MNLLLFVSKNAFFEPAVLYTRSLAENFDAKVTVFYVTKNENQGRMREEIKNKVTELLAGVEIEFKVGMGEKLEQLNLELASKEYEILIIGARMDLNAVQRMIGSRAMKVIESTPTHVLVVRKPCTRFNKVLICTGGTIIADKVIRVGSRIAEGIGAEVTLMHVGSKIPRMYTGLVEMDETIDTMLETDTPLGEHMRKASEIIAKQGLKAEVKLRHGEVVDEILDEIHNSNFDMVVIGASGANSTLSGWLMGNVTYKIVSSAECPVLVVK